MKAHHLAVIAAWLLFGLVAAVAQYIGFGRDRGLTFGATAFGPVLASSIWALFSLGLIRITRRWPLWPGPVKPLLGHLVGAAAASFVLNGCFHLVAAGLGVSSRGMNELAAAALQDAVVHLHLNAGAYIVIALLATLGWRAVRTQDESPGPRSMTSLTVRIGGVTHVIPVPDIDWIEGAGDYARLHVNGKTYLSSERLKSLEQRLDVRRFARIHRSTIVNLERVRALKHRSHGDYDLELEDGTELRVSRGRRDAIEGLLS